MNNAKFLTLLLLLTPLVASAGIVSGKTEHADLFPNARVARNLVLNPNMETRVPGDVVTSGTGIGTPGTPTTNAIFNSRSMTITMADPGDKIKIKTKVTEVGDIPNACVAALSHRWYDENGAYTNEFKMYVVDGSDNVLSNEVSLTPVNGTLAVHQNKNYRQSTELFQCPETDNIDVVIEKINTTASITLKFDNVESGPLPDPGLIAIPSGSEFFGSIKYAETPSCSWHRTGAGSDSYGNFAADTDCPTATVKGSVVAPGTKIPAFIIPAGSPPGVYVFQASGMFQKTSTGNAPVSFRFNDGTNSSSSSGFYSSTVPSAAGTVIGEITYNSALAANTTVNIQGRTINTSNSVSIFADAVSADLEIRVYRFSLPGSSYDNVIHAKNMDYPPTAFTATSQGLGTLTTNGCLKSRGGSRLRVSCSMNVGTVSGSEARIFLPDGLTVNSSLPAHPVGDMDRNEAGGNSRKKFRIKAAPGNNYVTFSNIDYAVASSPTTNLNGDAMLASSQVVQLTFEVEIEQWKSGQSAPFIKGLVISRLDSPLRVETFKTSPGDCTAGTCTYDGTKTPGITLTFNSTGNYDVEFSPPFSVAPVCIPGSARGGSGHLCQMSSTVTTSSTQINCQISTTGAAVNTRPAVICFGVP